MELHIENKCRVCGNKPKGYKHNKNSDACQGILSSVFGLDVAAESDEIYPPVVCNSCYLTMRELEKAKQKGAARATNLVLYSWTPHRGVLSLFDGVKRWQTCQKEAKIGDQGQT